MTRKRYRKVSAKPGELKIAYGSDGERNIDLVHAWGDGCSKADSWLLHTVLNHERHMPSMDSFPDLKREPSLLKQLEERGYDLTTLRFSIQKKV